MCLRKNVIFVCLYVNRSGLCPIDHSFDIFGPVVRLTNTDKDAQDNNYMYQTIPFMWQRKRDREVCCFLVIMWSAASPQPRHYARNKRNIVLQYCFCAVAIGEEKYVYNTK